VGREANRPAIGARIKVTLPTPNGLRELHRTVSSGASFGSNPLRQEIGLENATAITTVEVLWPGSNRRQSFTGINVDALYELREGEPVAFPRPLKALHYPQAAGTARP